MYSKTFIRTLVICAIVATVLVGLPMGLVVYLSAPWNTIPTTAEAVGVWQVGNTDERMTLYPSHKIAFSNIPKGILYGDGGDNDDKTRRVSVTGKWDSFSRAEGYGPDSYISIDHSDASAELYSQGFGATRELVIGDYGSNEFELDFHRISATP